MKRAEIIKCIFSELERQGQQSKPGAPYSYNQDGPVIGIDGEVDVGEIADRILELDEK